MATFRSDPFPFTTTATTSGWYNNRPIYYTNEVAYNNAIYNDPMPPRKRTPLEWLDAEIEKTCALARTT